MNGKKKNQTTQPTPGVCQGIAPLVIQALQRLGPPKEARVHFETARIEILKGIRALIDARIEHISNPGRKGEKIRVD